MEKFDLQKYITKEKMKEKIGRKIYIEPMSGESRSKRLKHMQCRLKNSTPPICDSGQRLTIKHILCEGQTIFED